MKFRNVFSDPSTNPVTVTEQDIIDKYELARRRANGLARDAKRTADDDTKAAIDAAMIDLTDMLADWRDDDIDDVKRNTTPRQHSAVEKLANSKYDTFADLLNGFNLKLASAPPAAPSDDSAQPTSIFVIDDKETTLVPTDATHVLLAQYSHEKGKKVEIKTPDGLLLPYFTDAAPAAADDDDDDDNSNPDVGNIVKVEINGKARRVLTIKYGKDKLLALINQAKTKTFKCYDDADDSGEDIIWHQIVKKSTGIGRDGHEVFAYVLATKNPVIRTYRG